MCTGETKVVLYTCTLLVAALTDLVELMVNYVEHERSAVYSLNTL